MYLAKSDEEIELAIKGTVKLYELKRKYEISEKYNIGSILTRMLHNSNKIDRAIEIFKDNVNVALFSLKYQTNPFKINIFLIKENSTHHEKRTRTDTYYFRQLNKSRTLW